MKTFTKFLKESSNIESLNEKTYDKKETLEKFDKLLKGLDDFFRILREMRKNGSSSIDEESNKLIKELDKDIENIDKKISNHIKALQNK